MLRKENRLRSSSRIREIRSSGQSWHNRWLVLSRLASTSSASHFAISVSRRLGAAVSRNRVRRLIGESIRLRLPRIGEGWDVLVIARLPARAASFVEIDGAVADLLRRSGLEAEIGVSEQRQDQEARTGPAAVCASGQRPEPYRSSQARPSRVAGYVRQIAPSIAQASPRSSQYEMVL